MISHKTCYTTYCMGCLRTSSWHYLCTSCRFGGHFVIAHVILCYIYCFPNPWLSKGESDIVTRWLGSIIFMLFWSLQLSDLLIILSVVYYVYSSYCRCYFMIDYWWRNPLSPILRSWCSSHYLLLVISCSVQVFFLVVVSCSLVVDFLVVFLDVFPLSLYVHHLA